MLIWCALDSCVVIQIFFFSKVGISLKLSLQNPEGDFMTTWPNQLGAWKWLTDAKSCNALPFMSRNWCRQGEAQCVLCFCCLSAIECNPGQVVNTHVPLSPSSIIWYRQWAVIPCSCEVNRRSGVALATHHKH